MRKGIGLAIILTLLCGDTTWAGLGNKKTMYVGGTVTAIKEGDEGTSSTRDEKVFEFDYKDGRLIIPYDRINDLEYGQKAGRRLGLAIAVNPILFFSKKRKHFLTV